MKKSPEQERRDQIKMSGNYMYEYTTYVDRNIIVVHNNHSLRLYKYVKNKRPER